MIALTIASVAAVLATAAFAGFIYLLANPGPPPEPPEWVNDGSNRRPYDRPTRRGDWREDCIR
jgi:hypothetical protein